MRRRLLLSCVVAWEFFGKPDCKIRLWLRTYLTLLMVTWLDVLLFATGALARTPGYFSIMRGTLLSRLFISVFTFPFLYGYLQWRSAKKGLAVENRPVLTILLIRNDNSSSRERWGVGWHWPWARGRLDDLSNSLAEEVHHARVTRSPQCIAGIMSMIARARCAGGG
jgi:hypothetical protein